MSAQNGRLAVFVCVCVRALHFEHTTLTGTASPHLQVLHAKPLERSPSLTLPAVKVSGSERVHAPALPAAASPSPFLATQLHSDSFKRRRRARTRASVCSRRTTCELLVAFLPQLHVTGPIKQAVDGGERANASSSSSAGRGLLWPATALSRSTDQPCFMGAAATCGAAGRDGSAGKQVFGGGRDVNRATAG